MIVGGPNQSIEISSHAQSAHLLQRKYPPEETAPPSVSPGVSPLVGVAVQGVDRMEVCGRPDETQDRAPVAWACLSPMVALEISTERGASNHRSGNASIDPTF